MLDFTQYDKKSLAKVGNVDSSSVLVLEKDSILRLEKDAPSLRHCTVGLSWDAAQDGASPVDLDLSALYIVPNERITKANVNERFCYYGNPNNSGGRERRERRFADKVLHGAGNMVGGR